MSVCMVCVCVVCLCVWCVCVCGMSVCMGCVCMGCVWGMSVCMGCICVGCVCVYVWCVYVWYMCGMSVCKRCVCVVYVCVWGVRVWGVCMYGVCMCVCVSVCSVGGIGCAVCVSSFGRGFGWRPAPAGCLEGPFPRCCLVGGRGAPPQEMSGVASDERDWGQRVGQQLLLSRSCAFLNPQDREVYECFPHLLVQEDLSLRWSGRKEEALG